MGVAAVGASEASDYSAAIEREVERAANTHVVEGRCVNVQEEKVRCASTRP